jgi:hypothetical protein
MTPMIPTPVIGLAAVALVLVAGGCGSRGYVTVPRGEDVEGGLSKARASRFPIYYAGRTFAGLPLTDVEVEGPDRTLIAYGKCRIALPADGGCSVPVQIQHFPFKSGDWRLAVNCHRRPSLLGVPTVRHDGPVLFTEWTGREDLRALRGGRPACGACVEESKRRQAGSSPTGT